MLVGRMRFLALMLVASAGWAEMPVVIAHRGGGALKPENTLAAFRHSLSLGVPVMEFDMNLTADDGLIIHHDSTVNAKICRGEGVTAGPIRGLTLAQLARFDCGQGERMPTLDSFLTAVTGSKALLLGETKMPVEGGVDPEKFVEKIDAVIRKHGLASRFILQSADYRTLDAMRRRNPEVRICLLSARRFKPDYLAVAKKHGGTHLMLRWDDVSGVAQVRQLQGAGLVVYSGTANTPEEWNKYVEMGFDGILTDDPAALRVFLRGAR